jgi:RNA polymerase sporulation-specific sigma factor
MILQGLKDEELIKLYRDGNEDAIDIIFERYKYLVRKKAKAMYIAGGDNDDLIQEGMIGLYKAVRDYNEDRQASFATFAGMCINRHMMSAVTASNRKKNIPLNSYVSFDAPADGDEQSGTKLVEVLKPDNEQNPEYMFIDREHTRLLEDKIISALSVYEKKVLDMYLEGKDYIEIAKELNKQPKSVDNAIQRIRIKVARIGKRGGLDY